MCVQISNRLANGPQKIIVLVANHDLRDTASYWSEALGFAVDAARNGAHAAKLLQEGAYQALVTDRFVPPWPGLASIPRLKRLYPSTRLVVLLKRGPIGIGSMLRVAGADAVIEPPVRQAALMTALLPNPAGRHIDHRNPDRRNA
jgi:DNA-binding response OmpR family regulator